MNTYIVKLHFCSIIIKAETPAEAWSEAVCENHPLDELFFDNDLLREKLKADGFDHVKGTCLKNVLEVYYISRPVDKGKAPITYDKDFKKLEKVKNDCEAFHIAYDEIMEKRLKQLDPDFMKKLHKIGDGRNLWYA